MISKFNFIFQVLCGLTLTTWSAFFKHEHISKDSVLLSFIGQLVCSSVNILVKVSLTMKSMLKKCKLVVVGSENEFQEFYWRSMPTSMLECGHGKILHTFRRMWWVKLDKNGQLATSYRHSNWAQKKRSINTLYNHPLTSLINKGFNVMDISRSLDLFCTASVKYGMCCICCNF